MAHNAGLAFGQAIEIQVDLLFQGESILEAFVVGTSSAAMPASTTLVDGQGFKH